MAITALKSDGELLDGAHSPPTSRRRRSRHFYYLFQKTEFLTCWTKPTP